MYMAMLVMAICLAVDDGSVNDVVWNVGDTGGRRRGARTHYTAPILLPVTYLVLP